MQAGRMDRLIEIRWPGEGSQSASGEIAATVARAVEVWAQVTPSAGNERFAADQRVAEADTVFRIRWLAGVTPLSGIFYDAHLYDVVSVLEVGRQEGLDILARCRPEREDDEA